MGQRKHVSSLLAGLAVLGAALLLGAAPSNQLTFSVPSGAASPQSYVPDELLLKFKPAVGLASQQQSISSLGAANIGALGQPGWVLIKLPIGLSVTQATAAYRSDPGIAIVQPNYLYRITAAPNDPGYASQWALKNTAQTVATSPQAGSSSLYPYNNPGASSADLDVEPAWDHITDCSSVTVAVVDTGVNYSQGDLASNMWNGGAAYPNHGWNYVDNNADPMDLHGHGTHVAGIIGAAGNNGAGTAGICWKASIMAVRVLDATGSGTTAAVIQGLNFAITHGARVVNMSLGGASFDQAFSDAITSAQDSGVVVVVAAGNSAVNTDSGATPTYPCNFTQANLVCVAALDQSYQLATFSNFGAASVDIGAPGTNILNTWAGTSAVATDPLTTGWTFTTTAGGVWAYESLVTNIGATQFLADPPNFPNGLYGNATDDRAYKTFNMAGDAAVLQFGAAINLASNDHFRAAYSSDGGDPFTGGTTAFDVAGVSTLPYIYYLSVDVSGCIGGTCSLGFQLQSDAAGQGLGIGVTAFTIQTMSLNTGSYNTISGTSMASPHVAGVAAMLMAYNPLYTCADVVDALKNGGRAVAVLRGKTATGKALDAMGALSYIGPPTGLQAHVQ